MGFHLWGRTESDTTESDLAAAAIEYFLLQKKEEVSNRVEKRDKSSKPRCHCRWGITCRRLEFGCEMGVARGREARDDSSRRMHGTTQ